MRTVESQETGPSESGGQAAEKILLFGAQWAHIHGAV